MTLGAEVGAGSTIAAVGPEWAGEAVGTIGAGTEVQAAAAAEEASNCPTRHRTAGGRPAAGLSRHPRKAVLHAGR
jgi:hypothetical protein